MNELLGIVLGLAIGSGVSALRPRRLQAAALLPAVLAAGVLTSAVNGELGTGLWGVFVAVDTVMAALGVALGVALVPRLVYRPRRTSTDSY